MRRAMSVTPAGTVKLEVPTCKGCQCREGTDVSKAAVTGHMFHAPRMNQPTQQVMHDAQQQRGSMLREAAKADSCRAFLFHLRQ
jgi:hypothetical protein